MPSEVTKRVKKLKPNSKPVKVKRVEPPISDSVDDNPISKKSKSEMKNKKKKEVKEDGEVEGQKRERKVYELPGQKRDPPEERDPLRIFYETLYEQTPDNELAAIWMMESGLLPEDVAKEVYDRKRKKSELKKLGSPMKDVSTTAKKGAHSKSVTVKKVRDSSTKKNTTVTTVKTKKRKKGDCSDEEEDDFVISKVV